MRKPKRDSSLPLRVAIYARVSTADQNCEMQLRELRDYVTRSGWPRAAEYVDTGISGSKISRPQLDRLMTDARERRLDVVLVWKLDRWGRSLGHCVSSINELVALKVRWIAYTQNLDTDASNPISRLMLHLMAAFAEFEREIIRDRVISGIQAARARGVVLGRKPKTFDRYRAVELRLAGCSVNEIAAKLQIGHGTAQRLLEQQHAAEMQTAQRLLEQQYAAQIQIGPGTAKGLLKQQHRRT